VRRADITTFICRLSENPGSLNLLEPYGPVQAYNGIALPLPFFTCTEFRGNWANGLVSDIRLRRDGQIDVEFT
jgi:hypothetical protein